MRKKITNTKTKNNTYDTITEEGVTIEDPGETKNHIADFYENLYQAREGKPGQRSICRKIVVYVVYSSTWL